MTSPPPRDSLAAPVRRPLALAALALALLHAPAPAAAQPRAAVAGAGSARPRAESDGFRAQMGIPVAQRLLASDDFATRIRGIERLGGIGTSEAVDALVDAMDPSSVAARDPRARLTAVRVLAGEARRDNVRQLLTREVTDTSGGDGRGGVSPLAGVLRATAALALARLGDRKAVADLIRALIQSGPSAEVVTRALRTYPPASLESFLEGRKRLSPVLATFLGELGDLRAVPRLRAMLQEAEPAAKIAAAAALGRLGDESALPVARAWSKTSDPRLRLAAADVLVHLDAPEAPAAVAALLTSEKTREEALRLALLAPAPALAAPLATLRPDLPAEQRGRAVAAIGRAGGVAQLAPLLDRPDLALAAAFALAVLPGAEARAALERAVEQARAGDKAKAGARRLLLRASVVRALVLDDAPAGLKDGCARSSRRKTLRTGRPARSAWWRSAPSRSTTRSPPRASPAMRSRAIRRPPPPRAGLSRSRTARPRSIRSCPCSPAPPARRIPGRSRPRPRARATRARSRRRSRSRPARCSWRTPRAPACPPRCSPPGPRRAAPSPRSRRGRSLRATTTRSAAASSASSRGAIPSCARTSPSASPAIPKDRPCRSSPPRTASRKTPPCAAPSSAPSRAAPRCSASPRWCWPAISIPTTRSARSPTPPSRGAISTRASARRSASSREGASRGRRSSPTTPLATRAPAPGSRKAPLRTARVVRADGVAGAGRRRPRRRAARPGLPAGLVSLQLGRVTEPGSPTE